MASSMTSLGKALSFAIVVLAFFWLVTIRVPTALWIGSFSLNAYLTGVVALLAGLLTLATLLTWRSRLSEQVGGKRLNPAVLVGVLSSVPFLLYSTVALGLDFRIEGFQNGLVWSAFVLVVLSLPWWLSSRDLVRIAQVLRVVVLAVPLTKIVTFYTGTDFYGEASYALVAVVLLVWAVSRTPKSWYDELAPWLLLFSILLCNVRTAAVVAAVVMVFAARSLPLPRLWKLLAGLFSLAVSALLVWLFVGDRIVNSGDRGLASVVGEDSFLARIGTTKRAEGWLYVLDNLPPGTNWFGQGAGLSSYLIDDLLGIHHPHNEYLRVFFDFGFVGFGLFLAGCIALFIALLVIHFRNKSDFTFAAVLMLPAVGLTAVTDNPFVFVYVMVPVGLVVSGAIATELQRIHTPTPAVQPSPTVRG